MKFDVPREIAAVGEQLRTAGYEAYLVGGCVRDLLLGRIPKDWDFTTNATPDQIQAVFPDSYYENDFGTVGVKTGSEEPALAIAEITPVSHGKHLQRQAAPGRSRLRTFPRRRPGTQGFHRKRHSLG